MRLNSVAINNEKLNGLNYFSMWVKKSGNYRISRVPHKSKMDLIFAPEKSGIIEAYVMRNDSLIYPAEIVLGGKALIINHDRESSEYSILARFISERGEESEVITFSMTSCFDKTSSTRNLENNNQLRKYFHGLIPPQAGTLKLIEKSTMYVSR